MAVLTADKQKRIVKTRSDRSVGTPTLIGMAEGVTRILRAMDYYPHTCEITTPSIAEVQIGGTTMVNFSSNSFLGLCDHPRIVEAQKIAITQSGTGAGSARLVVSHGIHRQLEERIAAFKHREDAVIFSTGMLVNLGVIPALASSPVRSLMLKMDAGESNLLFGSVSVFLDKYSHSCIYDGAALAEHNKWGGQPANIYRYNHLDVNQLRRQLESDSSEQRIIATDGVFSIYGHIAPLREIIDLAQRYNAIVYVDDAHGTGVLGPSGRGTAEELGCDSEVDVPVGTFSKALGGAGGFVAGSKDFCDYLRVACRTYVFQTAMPPSNAAGLIAALDVIEEEPWRREQVLTNARYVRSEVERLGFSTCGSRHHIVPVLIGDEMVADQVATGLLEAGVYAGCIRYPAVPLGEAIIRCNMMATHTEQHLNLLVEILELLGREYGLI